MPRIVRGNLPGPKAREIIERDGRALGAGNWRYLPFVPKAGKDVWIEDVDGNVFLDFVSGAAVLNVGINNDTVTKAVDRQLREFTYSAIPGYFYHATVDELCEKLAKITPGFSAKARNKKVLFGLSGADAADAAMKLARLHTKRWRFISFVGCNHGLAAYGAVSLQGLGSKMAEGFGPLVPGVTHIPYPYPYRPPFEAKTPEEGEDRIIEFLENYVFKTLAPPTEFAGIFVEPIQGDGGVLTPTPNFFRKLGRVARENGILMIVDEVQTGLGRTGRMFGTEHYGSDLVPDLVLLGKPLGSGLPVSAVVGRSDLMDLPVGSHASTTAGHLLGCAAALATIEEIEKRRLAKNAARVGERMISRFREFRDSSRKGSEYLGDVRGKGLLIGLEVVTNSGTKEPGTEEIRRINFAAFRKGLLTAYDGLRGNVFRLMPSLTLIEKDADTGAAILENSFGGFKI
jgi:4-aminobutyrate aminotransferase